MTFNHQTIRNFIYCRTLHYVINAHHPTADKLRQSHHSPARHALIVASRDRTGEDRHGPLDFPSVRPGRASRDGKLPLPELFCERRATGPADDVGTSTGERRVRSARLSASRAERQ